MSENVKGLKKLLTILNKLPKELDADVSAIVEANAQEIELNAKKDAPVDTGKLQQTIATAIPVTDKGKNKSRVIVANAPYASFVEHGTYKMRAQPFLFPAFFKQQNIFINDLEDLLDELDKI